MKGEKNMAAIGNKSAGKATILVPGVVVEKGKETRATEVGEVFFLDRDRTIFSLGEMRILLGVAHSGNHLETRLQGEVKPRLVRKSTKTVFLNAPSLIGSQPGDNLAEFMDGEKVAIKAEFLGHRFRGVFEPLIAGAELSGAQFLAKYSTGYQRHLLDVVPLGKINLLHSEDRSEIALPGKAMLGLIFGCYTSDPDDIHPSCRLVLPMKTSDGLVRMYDYGSEIELWRAFRRNSVDKDRLDLIFGRIARVLLAYSRLNAGEVSLGCLRLLTTYANEGLDLRGSQSWLDVAKQSIGKKSARQLERLIRGASTKKVLAKVEEIEVKLTAITGTKW